MNGPGENELRWLQGVDVIVLFGRWVKSGRSEWNFVLLPQKCPKLVRLEPGMSYSEVVDVAKEKFELTFDNVSLCFWRRHAFRGEGQDKEVPYVIKNNKDMNMFLVSATRTQQTQLYLTTEILPAAFSEEGNQEVDADIIGPQMGDGETTNGNMYNVGGRVQQQLWDSSSTDAGEEDILLSGVDQMDPLETMIRLADAGTPSPPSNALTIDLTRTPVGSPTNWSVLEWFTPDNRIAVPTVNQEKGKGIWQPEGIENTGDQNVHHSPPNPTTPIRPRRRLEIGEPSMQIASGMQAEWNRDVTEQMEDTANEEDVDISDQVWNYCRDRHKVARNLAEVFESVREEAELEFVTGPAGYDDGKVLENPASGAIVADEELQVGRTFESKTELQNAISLYAIKKQFTPRQYKSDKKRVIVKCADPLCTWRVFATQAEQGSNFFEIRRLNLKHTCTIATRANYAKRATAKLIAEVLKSRYTNGKAGPRASEIPEIMLAELKVAITYNKAWRAKEEAILKARGSAEQSYKLLAVYLYLVKEANEGTVSKIVAKVGRSGQQEFKYMFLALGASIAGMKYLRKVVVVDATTVRAKFRGCLISACMQDGNFEIFPLAIAVVDTENEPAWTWFFKQLKQIVADEADLVLVSDRHPAIYAAIKSQYPNAFHGLCAVHLERNVKTSFKGKGLDYLVGRAARAYTVGEHKKWFEEIKRRSPECAAYLNEIPLPHWTQAYCKVNRYNIMSSNIAESWNNVVKKAITFPIVGLVESLRLIIMKWFCGRRAQAEASRHHLTDYANDRLIENQKLSAGMNVFRSSVFGFQVEEDSGKGYYCDLLKKQCTCNSFTRIQLPCPHALAAARFIDIDGETLAAESYTVDNQASTYGTVIYPPRNACDMEIPDNLEGLGVNPPEEKRGAGRPRKRRFIGISEQMANKRRRTCSICKKTGHNRATCNGRTG